MANYARERGKYGGIVGSIQVFTTTLPLANDPSDSNWKSKIPAGFLRCDGSVLAASLYPELAALLGTGGASKFKKPEQSLTEEQFQLPDLGSKYLKPGLATGTYTDLTLLQTATENFAGKSRVGAEVIVTSNIGSSDTISYTGNFTVTGQNNIDLLGNSKFTPPEDKLTSQTILDQQSFQAHGHAANQKVLNYTGNFKVGADGKGDGTLNVFAGHSFETSGNPTNTATSTHAHKVDWPISTDYSNNFAFSFPTFNVPADNIQTTINVATKTVTELPESIQPFILVEYIIKF
jgi:microcystin-dependent protein